MSTDKIIQHLINDDVASAKTETENLLYGKIKNILDDSTADLISTVYENSVGLAGLLEKKKKKEEDDKKSDPVEPEDGEPELDPVGQEDSDVDNDGDSDESDEYLNNRRDAVGKAIKKKKNGDEDGDDDDVNEAQYTSGIAKGTGTTSRTIGNELDLRRGLGDMVASRATNAKNKPGKYKHKGQTLYSTKGSKT